MSFTSVEGQAIVGVETLSENATLVAAKSLSTRDLTDQSVPLAFGLIGFKLYLHGDEIATSVRLHFSESVDTHSSVYKYNTDRGWEKYENAIVSKDGKSVTLVLEDGGIGDEDGAEPKADRADHEGKADRDAHDVGDGRAEAKGEPRRQQHDVVRPRREEHHGGEHDEGDQDRMRHAGLTRPLADFFL